MINILIAWIGKTDLRAASESKEVGIGPIAQAMQSCPFDEIALLSDCRADEANGYREWLKGIAPVPVTIHPVTLSSPTDFGEIYEAAVETIKFLQGKQGKEIRLTYHLSPGTPAMAAVWILLAKTVYSATLIESSKEHGVKVVQIPFDISAEFIPSLVRKSDERLEKLVGALPPDAPEFSDIIHRSPAMQRVMAKARLVAPPLGAGPDRGGIRHR